METIEQEKLGLKSMSVAEMRDTDGGAIIIIQTSANLFNAIEKGLEFVVEAGADLVRGIWDGFTHFVGK